MYFYTVQKFISVQINLFAHPQQSHDHYKTLTKPLTHLIQKGRNEMMMTMTFLFLSIRCQPFQAGAERKTFWMSSVLVMHVLIFAQSSEYCIFSSILLTIKNQALVENWLFWSLTKFLINKLPYVLVIYVVLVSIWLFAEKH